MESRTSHPTILQVGSSVLKTRARPFTDFGAHAWDLYRELESALRSVDGLAVAAPQIGHSVRAIVYWQHPEDPWFGFPVAMFNPEIVHQHSDVMLSTEGCLSIPDRTYQVQRSIQVHVKGQDFLGKPFDVWTSTPLQAAMFQHEIDHLNGILLPDKVALGGIVADVPRLW